MCGINGFNFEDEGLIRRMNELTKHRGPDDTGSVTVSGWSLGNNRLSIIDLSERGHQPMRSLDGRYVIVYNGELYNFQDLKRELATRGRKFVSETDTEVILYAYIEWGRECVKKFNGMFAFAILDSATGELFLARDQIGIKPLYYFWDPDARSGRAGKFIFSSEAKAIFAHNISKDINHDALNIYFRLLYVPAPLTIWEKIKKLEPGTTATVKDGHLTLKHYWEYKDKPLITDRGEIKKTLRELLTDSVSRQLISDRPVGIFLSGGIDSTIIAGLAAARSPHIQTFSVGFEETEEADKYNNDARIAAQTALHFGTDHHEYRLRAEEVINALPRSIYHMDEPISNHVQAVNMLLADRVRGRATVVLGGDGGDELFGGYERYYYNFLIDKIRKIPLLASTAGIFGKPEWERKIKSKPGVERYLEFFAQKEDYISAFLRSPHNDPSAPRRWFERLYFSSVLASDFTRQMMRTDVLSWLPSESLVRSDKMTMAASIEERVPFLDVRLVEFADRIPVPYKLGSKGFRVLSAGRHYQGKAILCEAFLDLLPEFVLKQPKWGWFSPTAKWLRGPLLPLMREVLSPSFNAGTRDMFDFGHLRAMLDDHISKKRYALNTLWSVLTFQLWYKEFMK